MAHHSQSTDAGRMFRENELLMTGGNGFLGKVILAMLLERYPQVKHVHVLLRPGKGLSAEERFQVEVVESPVMAALLVTRGEQFVRERVAIWPGDLSQADCGLDTQALSSIASRVKLILNCAGKVEFFPPVDESLRANVDGVQNAITLAKRAGARLLHVSTCFVSGEANGLIEETEPIVGFYPHRKGAEDHAFDALAELAYCREQVRLITASETSGGTENPRSLSKEAAQKLVALGKRRAEHWGWVNTYTYSKSLGEQLNAREQDLRWSIVRPAIVESALRFPFPGWIEGGRTAAPLVLMAMGGLKHWPVS